MRSSFQAEEAAAEAAGSLHAGCPMSGLEAADSALLLALSSSAKRPEGACTPQAASSSPSLAVAACADTRRRALLDAKEDCCDSGSRRPDSNSKSPADTRSLDACGASGGPPPPLPPPLKRGPRASESEAAGFEPASCCKPACQGPGCPLACCSSESVCLGDLLHAEEAAAAATHTDFFSSARNAASFSSSLQQQQQHACEQQQQRMQGALLQQQQPHFHPDRGPSATALPPGRRSEQGAAAAAAAAGAPSMERSMAGLRLAHGTPAGGSPSSEWFLLSGVASPAADEEEGPRESLGHALERDIFMPPEGRDRAAVAAAAAAAAAAEDGESGGAPTAGGPVVMRLRKRDKAENLLELGGPDEEASFVCTPDQQAAPSGEVLLLHALRAPSEGSPTGAAGVPWCSQQREGPPSRWEDAADSHRQQQQQQQQQEGRSSAANGGLSWLTGFYASAAREEDPWEMTYETFVRWRLSTQREEEEAAGGDSSAAERTGGDGVAPQQALPKSPKKAAAAAGGAAAAAANGCSSSSPGAPPLLGLRGPSLLDAGGGAPWSESVNAPHPVVLPRGSDLVTYVEIEDGDRREQHALYSREEGTFGQGDKSFCDVFEFIRWVHAERGGAPFPWESLAAAAGGRRSSRKTQRQHRRRKEEEETQQNELEDDSFDPDAPVPLNTLLTEDPLLQQLGSGSPPWSDTQQQPFSSADAAAAAAAVAAGCCEETDCAGIVEGGEWSGGPNCVAAREVSNGDTSWLPSSADVFS
ncbi:hypothetical protein Efla_005050 [Eimeria flavescens]